MRNKASFFKRMRLMSLVCVMALTGILFSGCPVDPTTYTVTFRTGDGSGTAPAKETVTDGESITLPGQGDMKAPSGKTFTGWKSDSGSTTYEAGAKVAITADTVFIAQWKAGSGGNTYTVSFSAGEGTGTAPAKETVTAGASVTLPAKGDMTAPSGKTFDGWKSGSGSTYEAGAKVAITADTVFTAQWKAGSGGNTYTVSFSAGEGSGTAPASQTVTAGASVTLPQQGALTAPSGKTFAGWKSGSTTYEAGASVVITADTVFTAQWTAGSGGNTYTVSFSTGEGSGTAPVSQTVTAGASVTLPQQGAMAAPAGKTFAGWKSGSDSTYEAGASVTITAATVFTAQWAVTTYSGFYNYPTGRVDNNNGTLTITNTVASQTLLFIDTVGKDNYIGTVGSLSSVKVKLPAEKFYTIVAVDKTTYEEQGLQASQSNVLTHYSNTMAYSVSVTPLVTYGGGTWIFNNNSAYWVQIRKTDMSGNYAVIAPNAQRVSIPIALSTPYDYYVYFYKELKLNGKVIAVVESSDRSQSNTAQVTNAATPYTTNIQATDIPSNIKPAVMVKNNSNKSVRVYYANQQKTNGSLSADFVIVGGASELLTGFEPDDDTTSINFAAVAWESNKFVPESITMQNDKVYEIIIPQNEEVSGITVTEVEASKYYN